MHVNVIASISNSKQFVFSIGSSKWQGNSVNHTQCHVCVKYAKLSLSPASGPLPSCLSSHLLCKPVVPVDWRQLNIKPMDLQNQSILLHRGLKLERTKDTSLRKRCLQKFKALSYKLANEG